MNTDEGLHSGATVLCWMGRGGALLVFALMLIVLALDGARTSMWHWLAGLIVAEQQAALQRALDQLSDRQRAAIALFHFEGLSGHDSALAMNLSESAFESLLTRARSALRQRVHANLNDGGRM